ncbi:MAG: delta-60 repeat domain-containing protein [Candidatus Moraniibacteriota bacterium]
MKKEIKNIKSFRIFYLALIFLGICQAASAADLANDKVEDLAAQSDGKIIVGGSFTSFSGVATNRIARLSTNGLVDTSFNIGEGANGPIQVISVQPDDKILIGGHFTAYNGVARNCIARLNADGTLDTGFDPGTGAYPSVYSINIQSDGKILIGGDFIDYNDVARSHIARLNADGTLDTSFNPGAGATGMVQEILIQPDGKIIIVGFFSTYDGMSRNRIARINTDGTIDTSFDPGTGADGFVYAASLQSDGKIVIGGAFNTYNEFSIEHIARINTNGTLDTSFDPGAGADNSIWSSAIQADGKIIILGSFTGYNNVSRNRIARINTDGSLDTSFSPAYGADNYVESMIFQSDGKMVIGGWFQNYDSVPRNYITRINADGTIERTFDGIPVLAEVTPFASPSSSNTPEYVFSSTEAGTIEYGGDCSSIVSTAAVGSNTIIFSAMAEGIYSNCSITVVDGLGNNSNTLYLDEFVIDAADPSILSISRYTPEEEEVTDRTNAKFKIIFSEPVKNVSLDDFVQGGTAAAAITEAGVVEINGSDSYFSSEYFLDINSLFDGTYGLTLSGTNNIEDTNRKTPSLTIGVNESYNFKVVPIVEILPSDSQSADYVEKSIIVTDDTAILSSAVTVNSDEDKLLYDNLAQISDLVCTQINTKRVECSFKVLSTGEIMVTATDVAGNIGSGSADSDYSVFDIPKPDVSFSGKLKSMALSSKNKMLSKNDEIRFKGTFSELSGGTVVIKYKKGSGKSEEEIVTIGDDGKWSKKVKFDDNGSYKVKFTYFNKNGEDVGSKGSYAIKIDTQDPEFKKMPAKLSKKVGAAVWWEATDNDKIKEYKCYFNGKKYETKKSSFSIPQNTPKGTYNLEIWAYDKAKNKEKQEVLINVN